MFFMITVKPGINSFYLFSRNHVRFCTHSKWYYDLAAKRCEKAGSCKKHAGGSESLPDVKQEHNGISFSN